MGLLMSQYFCHYGQVLQFFFCSSLIQRQLNHTRANANYFSRYKSGFMYLELQLCFCPCLCPKLLQPILLGAVFFHYFIYRRHSMLYRIGYYLLNSHITFLHSYLYGYKQRIFLNNTFLEAISICRGPLKDQFLTGEMSHYGI